MSISLANSWSKLDWGNRHLDTLKTKLARAFDLEKHPVVIYKAVERQTPAAAYVWQLEDFPEPPDDTGLLVGDIIGNFRAALDHMCWQLVKERGLMPRDPKLKRKIEFPMATRRGNFNSGVRRTLPSVPSEFTTIIKRYQPYRRGDESQAIRLLQRLSNTDKHRVLVPTTTGHAKTELTLEAINCTIVGYDFNIGTTDRSLKVGTILAIADALDDLGSIGQGIVKMEGEIVPHPSFGRGIAIEESLTYIAATIAKLLGEIENVP